MPIAFLLAMQASGMIVDWLGKNDQIRMSRMGAQLEQAGINSNIASSRLQYEDESLQSMKNLRMNLGSQAAMLAARGIRGGSPTSAILSNESTANFNADERIRKINQSGQQAGLRANKLLSGLHQNTSENNTWNKFRSNVFKQLPTSPSAYNQYAGAFGLTKIAGTV